MKLAALLSFAPLAVLAVPAGINIGSLPNGLGPFPKFAGCDVSGASIAFPQGQTALAVPEGTAPTHIVLGTGVQNYTCGAAGTYAAAGAVASLYDLSCLYGHNGFADVEDKWFSLPAGVKALIEKGLKKTPLYVGDHFFVTNPITGTGISPLFNLKSGPFSILARAAGIPAPTGPPDVDWLQLSNVQGSLAKTIFRVDTENGAPPASCTPGQTLSVPYATKYWFYS